MSRITQNWGSHIHRGGKGYAVFRKSSSVTKIWDWVCILSKFANGTKMSDAVDIIEESDVIQKDQGKTEKWPHVNLKIQEVQVQGI